MTGIVDFFTEDHGSCDRLYAALEEALADEDGPSPEPALVQFERALDRHLAMEEGVLFPALEEATGQRGGPTAVMRMEHAEMRRLLAQVSGALSRGDRGAAQDAGDTLMMVIQQHNVKEEGMLYPMAEAALGGAWEALYPRLLKLQS